MDCLDGVVVFVDNETNGSFGMFVMCVDLRNIACLTYLWSAKNQIVI